MIFDAEAGGRRFLLRLKGVICGFADLEAPWEAVQQGTGRHWLYVVRRGTCSVELIQESRVPISLGEGDVLAVADDAAHTRKGRGEVRDERAG